MSLNPEQESPLEQYQPRGEFFSIVGSVYRYLRFSGPPHLSVAQLAGKSQAAESAFISHMQDNSGRLQEFSRPTKTGEFALGVESCRNLLRRSISRSTYFGAASISSVGPLPIGGKPSGNIAQAYPKHWSFRDQVAAFMLDERRYLYGSLDATHYRDEGKFSIEPRVAGLDIDTLKNHQPEADPHSWGKYISSQHHNSLVLGLDSPKGQQQFMKFVTSMAVLLEAAKIKYER